MGLLDKVESTEKDIKKAKPVAVAKPVEAKPSPKKEKKEKKPKKVKAKKSRPEGLSSEFEIAPKLSRVICWWVNFTANFALLIAALVMNVLTGANSGGGANTTLFIIAFLVLIFNAIFLPIYTAVSYTHLTLPTNREV